MNGLILVNKPQRLTSHDVVQQVRRLLHIQRVGHFGTLDPLATGLMIIALGRATRFFSFYAKLDKEYHGQITLGFSTNTYDADGTPSSVKTKGYPSEGSLLEAMEKLTGVIEQTPPLFSAKKFKGTPLYVFARKNKDIKLNPVQIHIHYFRLIAYHPPFVEFDIACSSGTYIRSLAHDLGQFLKCGAHLSQLERTAIGHFFIQSSYTLDTLEKLAQEDKIQEVLIPLESLLPEFPIIVLTDEGVTQAKNGNCVFSEHIHSFSQRNLDPPRARKDQDEIIRLFSQKGRFLALGRPRPERNGFHPFLVIDSEDSEM